MGICSSKFHTALQRLTSTERKAILFMTTRTDGWLARNYLQLIKPIMTWALKMGRDDPDISAHDYIKMKEIYNEVYRDKNHAK